MVLFPVLIGEMAKREVPKRALADSIGVCYKALNNKLNGKAPFTWPEVKVIRQEFFPDIPIEKLFAQADPDPTPPAAQQERARPGC